MLKLYLNFLIFCMVISPSGLDFPIHTSGPLAWIGKSKPLGKITLQKIRKSFHHFNIVKFSVPNWNDVVVVVRAAPDIPEMSVPGVGYSFKPKGLAFVTPLYPV